jgi:hypothetical protein
MLYSVDPRSIVCISILPQVEAITCPRWVHGANTNIVIEFPDTFSIMYIILEISKVKPVAFLGDINTLAFRGVVFEVTYVDVSIGPEVKTKSIEITIFEETLVLTTILP